MQDGIFYSAQLFSLNFEKLVRIFITDINKIMKQLILTLSCVLLTVALMAQPARVPVNEPATGGNNKPNNNTNTTIGGNTNTTTTYGSSGELKKYSDSEGRFTIGYPEDWTFNDHPDNAVIKITSPSEGSNDKFFQNVNLQIEQLSSGTTIESYVKTNVDAVKELVKNYREVSSMYFNRNGSRAYQIIYKGKYGDVDYEIQIKQLFALVNGKAYILTYVCKEDERDAFETTANKIFNSFKY